MAEQLHISVSTVKRALKELTDTGYIQKEVRFREKNRGQSSNLYTLLFVEQTSEPENDNSPTKADRDHIDVFAAQEPQKDDAVEYITFDMLAANNKAAIQKQSKREITNKTEKSFYPFADKTMVRAPDQVSIPPGRRKLQGILDVNEMKDFLSVCYSSFHRWTGAESILRSP